MVFSASGLRGLLFSILLGVNVLLAGCSQAGTARSGTQPAISPAQETTPTRTESTTKPASPTPVFTLTSAPATRIPTQTATATSHATPTATPCPPEACSYPLISQFERPIAPPGVDTVDVTYRFGSTQGGQRDPHHGVEFLNGAGTPVLAAADGVVVVAGDDRLKLFAPYPNFYGNLVVLEHALPISGTQENIQSIYTLYAHLSEIMVSPGQSVKAGQEIGRVGMTGAATGSHLHFEVRLGENSYNAARNPELWLKSHLDADGNPMGTLAGRILNSGGKPIKVSNIVLQHLPDGPEGQSDWELYLGTYEDPRLRGQLPYQENFAAGDLPAGWYRITFPHYGVQQREFQVFPGQVSVITFNLED